MRYVHYGVKCNACNKHFDCVYEGETDCGIEDKSMQPNRLCVCPTCYKRHDVECKFLSEVQKAPEKVVFT